MIDFRYHLVSLVSVFLALAIGIILGAGPLQNSIGSTLQDQVDDLRVSRNEARAQVDVLTEEKAHARSALEVAGSQLIPGMMSGRSIAVITVPGVSPEVYDAVRVKIEASGARISARVALTENFTSADTASYRKALAANMVDNLEGIDASAETTRIFATAIERIVRSGSDLEQSQALMGFFTSGEADNTLATFETASFVPADAVLVIFPDSSRKAGEDDTVQSMSQVATEIYSALCLDIAASGSTVVLGSDDEGSVLSIVRSSGTGSTVDSVSSVAAQFNVVFALASEISGGHVALGYGEGATAPFGTRIDVSVQ